MTVAIHCNPILPHKANQRRSHFLTFTHYECLLNGFSTPATKKQLLNQRRKYEADKRYTYLLRSSYFYFQLLILLLTLAAISLTSIAGLHIVLTVANVLSLFKVDIRNIRIT